MKLYLVIHEPKARFRHSHYIIVQTVEATSRADAMRKAIHDDFAMSYKAPQAREVEAGVTIRI